ncbi:MAG: NADH-quinone oxidoreductase subunit A [Acidobacteria bacterium]|nr:NADH-quinone oxidoreductase subunit A [Acidobacteriota bacterium]
MDINILLSPPVAFLIFMVVAGVLYLFGKLIAPKGKPEPGKYDPYACGEEFQADRFKFGYAKFYVAALFFTIMHVAALTVATAPGGPTAFKAVAYLFTIGVSVFILIVDFD